MQVIYTKITKRTKTTYKDIRGYEFYNIIIPVKYNKELSGLDNKMCKITIEVLE